MLASTFRHLKGIGAKTELSLWRRGILSLEDLRNSAASQLSIFDTIPNYSEPSVETSLLALQEGDAEFFANHLEQAEHFRIALTYPRNTIFLDIETTGLSRYYDKITMIGWSLDGHYDFWLRGQDLDRLEKALSSSKAVVTFNGCLFDIPFLRSEFPDIRIPKAHIDLRFFVRRVGMRGGQKEIEEQLRIRRAHKLTGMTGETAPILWHRYIRGDIQAIQDLISYNLADISGLREILCFCIKAHLSKSKIPPTLRSKPDRIFPKPANVVPEDLHDSLNPEMARKATLRNNSISIQDILPPHDRPQPRVVGIDLTGSEKRPSGWCLLKGTEVVTDLIASDRDLIQATIECNPTIVSIDSPLTLPLGRTSASDLDPNREQYGITRECERILRKRGVSVYPCLIPSMQGLTTRGIRLATELRSLGIPVIESFPGAAQDVMGIPRKRASLPLLKEGLKEFGATGPFSIHDVSHDELDAITSALVGLFFWSGKFEALGNTVEDYLIIPDLSRDTSSQEIRVIGLSGPIAAGKTTSAEILSSRGYLYTRFSLVLADLLKDRGIPCNRATLQAIGAEVHKDPGQRWLCKRLAEFLPKQGRIVIDGLRWPEDHAFLIERFGPSFTHIHVSAPKELRLERYVTTEGDREEFEHALTHSAESGATSLEKLSHYVVDNSGTRASLEEELTLIIENFEHS